MDRFAQQQHNDKIKFKILPKRLLFVFRLSEPFVFASFSGEFPVQLFFDGQNSRGKSFLFLVFQEKRRKREEKHNSFQVLKIQFHSYMQRSVQFPKSVKLIIQLC